MRSKAIVGGLLAAALLSTAAYTQTAPSAPKVQAQTSMKKHTGDYRASKLIGVNVYNRQNEKIGDINEVLMAKSGRISGVVVGVGGFLGMGEHDVLVKLDQIKFVNEPVAAAVATAPAKPVQTGTAANAPATDPAKAVPANTTGTGTAANAPANTSTSNRAAVANRPVRAATEKWYPDHAVMNATKDQLKAMPAFKYSDYN